MDALAPLAFYLLEDYEMVAVSAALRAHTRGAELLLWFCPRWAREAAVFAAIVLVPEAVARASGVEADVFSAPVAVGSGRVSPFAAALIEPLDVWVLGAGWAWWVTGWMSLAALAALVPWPRGLFYYMLARGAEGGGVWAARAALVFSFWVTLATRP